LPTLPRDASPPRRMKLIEISATVPIKNENVAA
jgi:hypothetical protein